MIEPRIHDSIVKPHAGRWVVARRIDGVALAFADSKDEATRFLDAVLDLPRQLRGKGLVVK